MNRKQAGNIRKTLSFLGAKVEAIGESGEYRVNYTAPDGSHHSVETDGGGRQVDLTFADAGRTDLVSTEYCWG